MQEGLQEDEEEYLGDDDAQEHAQGIDGGICDRGAVAVEGIVGIVHCHGIGHRTAEHTADGGIVDVRQAQCQPPYQQHGDDGEQETHSHP